MVLPNIDILGGLSSLEIIVSGYLLAFNLFLKHARRASNKKIRNYIILCGIGMLSTFHAWFGSATNFLLLSFGAQPLGQAGAVLGYAWGPALGAVIWAYIASESLLKGRFKIPITVVIAIISIIFAVLVYAFPLEFTFYRPSPEGGLPSSGFRGLAMTLLAVVLIIMMVFLGPIIIINGLTIDDKSAKWKKFSMGTGIIMLSFFGIIDAAISEIPLIVLAMVKAFIFTSVFLIYEGVEKGI